jgi:K(+)-stimulated pyrophosphate-energized sodium pump
MEIAVILIIGFVSLAFAGFLTKQVMSKDTGTPDMRTISDAIREGAQAFLRRQYQTISILSVVLAVVIFLLYVLVRDKSPSDPQGASEMTIAVYTTASFVLGAFSSGVAGYIGMYVSIHSNIRTAAAARRSLNEALQVALRGGAVSGLAVVALTLLGVGGLYFFLENVLQIAPKDIPFLIVGYGFGASFVALFAQVGGGIYTKAADVGADLVGKVEAGIPEDDPRNPAVIADLVGDNVGDCAGRGADIFESTAAENIGAMILGVGLIPIFGIKAILFPLVEGAFGLIASIAGVMIVKTDEDADPMAALNRGFFLTALLAAIGLTGSSYWLLRSADAPEAWIYFTICGLIGIAASFAFVYITQYYTEYKYRPVRQIAESCKTGAATNVISGIAVGFESTAIPVIVISIAIIASYKLGKLGIPAAALSKLGAIDPGFFGTAVATIGMLSTAGYILAMDTFGPITDNAGGIVEMSQQSEEVRHKTDRLDSVGNTTKALTKGYAIGSAALAAFLLFSAYLDEVRALGVKLDAVNIAQPEIFVAGLIGATLVFVFSAVTIRAVGKAAYSVIDEVRRQFKEKPGIMEGKEKPDYARCVDIVTQGALQQMITPGLLAVGVPIATGLIFRSLGVGSEAMAAFLMVGTITGILTAMFLNNSGGAWDNAKKYIETGVYGGKRSEAHKAAVVGDTIGDPFKDTAGPSLHVLIKLLSTITLVLAPLFMSR